MVDHFTQFMRMDNVSAAILTNETDFQALFNAWNGSTEGSPERKKTCERLHAIIYHFPRQLLRVSPDVASDFYLYAHERIESYFLTYRHDAGMSFLSWISLCLRRDFLNFYKRRKRPADRELLKDTAEWDTEVGLLPGVIEEENEPWADGIRECLRQLKEEDRIHLKMHFGFPFTYADLRCMCQRLGIPTAFSNYRKYLFYLRDITIQTAKTRKDLLVSLSDLEQSMYKHGKTRELLARRERLQEKYFEQAGVIPLRLVAEFTGDPLVSVHRKVQGAIKKIEKTFALIVHNEKRNIK